MGELIAVLSGKGGTGKTSLCAGIATALADLRNAVLCIDCDMGLQNLDLALGLVQAGSLSFLDAMGGGYDLKSLPRHPDFPNLTFLSAPENCRADSIDRVMFSAFLEKARAQFDYIFLDAPAGIDAGFQLCAAFADRVILVTNGDAAAIRDAARTAQLLEKMGKPDVRLIVNRIDKKLFETMGLTVDDIMDQAALPLLGIVPQDLDVTLAAVFDAPLLCYSKKAAAAACRRIARRLQGIPVPITLSW